MIEVELPDGTIAEFPEGTSPDVIKGALQKRYAAPQHAAPSPQMQQGLGELSALTQNPDPTRGAKADFQAMSPMQQFGTSIVDAGNLASRAFGLRNMASAAVRAPFTDKSYSEERAAMEAQDDLARARQGRGGAIAEIGGDVLLGGLLAKHGLTLAGRGGTAAMTGFKGLLARSGLMAAEGAGYGAVSAAGNDQDIGRGAMFGAAGGAIAPAIAQGAAKVFDLGKAVLGKGNQSRAYQAIMDAISRSGKSVDDISADLLQAADDGQGAYNLADSLGNSGQRMLSGVARSPGDARQVIADTLMSRQAGQGDRLTNALVEGFDAPMTAAQKAASLKAGRSATAAVNYPAASAGASPVNLTGAIESLNKTLRRDPILGDTALSQGPMGARLTALRDRMQKGGEQLVDFDEVLNIKSDLYRQMKRNPDAAADFKEVYGLLDNALEGSSNAYRKANDTFAKQSRVMEAVDTGKGAASGRVRAQDSIPQFKALGADEQAAFRTGYSDPMIAKVQSTGGALTNKVRPIMTDKTGLEFPAFAAPGKSDQLGRRLAREKTMFETGNAALGGSKTADNLADSAEIAGFDPSMIRNALTGNWKQMAIQGITKSANAIQGRNSATRDLIAKALLGTGADAPKNILKAVEAGKKLTQNQMKIARALMMSGVLAGSQAGQP
jgi:hypothetical protein